MRSHLLFVSIYGVSVSLIVELTVEREGSTDQAKVRESLWKIPKVFALYPKHFCIQSHMICIAQHFFEVQPRLVQVSRL